MIELLVGALFGGGAALFGYLLAHKQAAKHRQRWLTALRLLDSVDGSRVEAEEAVDGLVTLIEAQEWEEARTDAKKAHTLHQRRLSEALDRKVSPARRRS